MVRFGADERRRCATLTPALVAAALPAVLVVAPYVSALWRGRNGVPSWTWDLDVMLIRGGLTKAPTFRETLSWWSGTWVGQVPFYRPLTSYLFWIEWKLFGNREWLYALPDVGAHIAATVLFAAFVFLLGRRRCVPYHAMAAVVAAWGFSGWLLEYRGSVASAVFYQWKNQPDAFAAICCFAALISYVRAQEVSRALPVAAIIWYLAGCGFKEIAIPLPAVCACLEGTTPFRGTDRASRGRLAAMLAAALALLSLRAMALHSIGYIYGANSDFVRRTVQELFGPLGSSLTGGEWLGNAVAIWIFAIATFCICRLGDRGIGDFEIPMRMLAAGGTLTLAVMGALGAAFMWGQGGIERASVQSPLGAVVGLFRCLQPVALGETIATLSLLVSLTALWERHAWAILLSFAWTTVYLAPLMFSPGPIHRYYISQGGYYLLYAFAAAVIWETVRKRLHALRLRTS